MANEDLSKELGNLRDDLRTPETLGRLLIEEVLSLEEVLSQIVDRGERVGGTH